MDSILAAFRGTRRAKPAEPTGLTAMFAAAGLFGGGGPGAVTSVFGRSGAVVAAANDYDASEVFNDSAVVGADVAAALDTIDAELDVIEGLAGFMVPLYDLVTLLPIDVEVTESGGNIVATLTDIAGAGIVTGRWDSVSHTIVTPATVNLAPGTATAPLTNYVFLTETLGVVALVANTTGFPVDALHLATIFVQTSTEVAADGPLGLHVHNDDPTEHIHHIGARFRAQNAEWKSGAQASIAIAVNGGAPDNVDVATTAGKAFQLHLHDLPVFDTGIASDVYVMNDSVTPWKKVTDLNVLLTDALGGSLSARRFSLTFVAIINNDTGESKLAVCLPTGSYNSDNGVLNDASKFAAFSIPPDLRGNAVLIAEAKLRHQTSGSGTWTLLELVDLRGLQPAIVAGGATSQATEFDETVFRVFDGVDATKQIALEAGAIAPATTRTIIMPDEDVTLENIQRAQALHGFTTSNYYKGTNGNLVGNATAFSASVLFRFIETPVAGGAYALACYPRFAGPGWALFYDNSRFKMLITQVTGGTVLENFVGGAYADLGDFALLGKLVLLHLVYDGTVATLYVNGVSVATLTPAGGLLVAGATTALTIGVEDNLNQPAAETAILGAGYSEVEMSLADVRGHYLDVMDAAAMVDEPGAGFSNMWSVDGETAAPATLSDSIGTDDLTLTGALSIESRRPHFL
jgi:hypothetical protein